MQERVGTPEVDDWLAARQAATYEIDHQRGPNPYISQQQDVGYWISQRVNFINDHASHAALLDECYRRAQAAPQHLQHVFDWIYIAQVRPPKPAAPEGGPAVLFPEPEPLPMADWIVGYAEQLSAYHAYVLGKRVERSPWPDVAARVLEHALVTHYTDADQSVLRRITRTCVNGLYRALPTREQQERSLRRETRAALARAYVKSGQAERAQPILEALIAEYGDDLPRSLITLSGQTQSATGQRVIQNRILDAEPEPQDKPRYWYRRARYFEGRQEWDRAEAAYLKAIELTPNRATDDLVHGVGRSQTVGNYENFLDRRKRGDEAAALLWQEFDAVAPTSAYARQMLIDISNLRSVTAPPFNSDQEKIWHWLNLQETWEYLEPTIINSMIKAARTAKHKPKSEPVAILNRALAMASHTHPTRSAAVGKLMFEHKMYSHATVPLQDALARLQNPGEKQMAASRLLRSYFKLGRIEQAQALWPTVRESISPEDAAESLRMMIDDAELHDAQTAAAQWRSDLHNLGKRYEKN